MEHDSIKYYIEECRKSGIDFKEQVVEYSFDVDDVTVKLFIADKQTMEVFEEHERNERSYH